MPNIAFAAYCPIPGVLYQDDGVYTYNKQGKKATLNPNLVSVCACESSYPGGKEVPRHYEKDGAVRYGRITSGDTGLCQINEPIHGKTAEKLGWNIDTPYGNIRYANYLYRNYGEKPWTASAECH